MASDKGGKSVAGVLPKGRPGVVRQLTEQGLKVWRYLGSPDNAEAGRSEPWRAQASIAARSCAARPLLGVGLVNRGCATPRSVDEAADMQSTLHANDLYNSLWTRAAKVSECLVGVSGAH